MVARDGIIGCYMMANRMHGTVYVGVTGHLIARVHQHRTGLGDDNSFTKRHGLTRLVWYETHTLMTVAIQREKSLKRYSRDWKCNLIERLNPLWTDLYDSLVSGGAAVASDPELYRDWTPREPEPPRPRPLPKDWPTEDK